MKKIVLSLLFLSYIMLSGCVKILNDELKTKETKLVLNAAITPDSVFTVNVSHTSNIFEDESADNLPFIDSAKVLLFEGDNLLYQLQNTGYGFYSNPGFYPQTGKQYKVTVSYGTYHDIESVASIPPKVPIVSLDTSSVFTTDEYGNNITNFFGEITYNDPPGVANYYQLSCVLYNYYNDSLVYVDPQSPVWPTDENERFFDSQSGSSLLWSDKLTDGKQVTFKFIFLYAYYGYNKMATDDKQTYKFEFHLKSITKSYFTYLKSLGVYWETGGSDNPFSEPVVIYSNVDNGYGILGAYNSDTISVSYTVSTGEGEGGKP